MLAHLLLGCGLGLGGVRLRIFAAEALDAPGGIDHLLLASEKRMAVGANFHVDIALVRGTGLESMATGALHTDRFVIGMNSLLWHRTETFLFKRYLPVYARFPQAAMLESRCNSPNWLRY